MAFACLDSLVNHHGLKEFLKERMPRMKLALSQMERLLARHLPSVHAALRMKEVAYELFCVQWFVTLFSFDVASDSLYTIWDVFLVRGWKFAFQLAIAFLQQMAPSIRTLEYEPLVAYIKSAIRDETFSHV
jgi:hypothetical protein